MALMVVFMHDNTSQHRMPITIQYQHSSIRPLHLIVGIILILLCPNYLLLPRPLLLPVSNFIDLSGIARSEGTVFYKLLQRLADKRAGQYIPIKFLSLARNDLARAPYSSLNLISTTLEYLSLAGNNFGVLNGSIIKGMWEPCR